MLVAGQVFFYSGDHIFAPSTSFIQKVPGLLPLLKWLVSITNKINMWRKMNIHPANCGKIIDIDN